jgi:hypothetical protein
MDPESRDRAVERARGMIFNSQMMENGEALSDRMDAHLAAATEMRQAFTEGLGEDVALPPHFDEALMFATGYLYRTGNPDFGEDLKMHLGDHLDKRMRNPQEDQWLPQDENDLNLVKGLIELGSRLGDSDKVRAFQPRRESDGGRPFEILDPYDCWYNKYGFWLPYSATHGTFQ